ncbi:MAG TPA: hypothetical protein PKZ92_03580, partial [Candidatus Woesebacteria bacterium]|nr:hypothetical protein [Candidatus Woesebacteria bacterium]
RGTLNLPRLTSAEGLVLPKNFSGTLYFSSLVSIRDLNLPENFDGIIYLVGSKISVDEKKFLRKKYPKSKIF